jgi:hypothetical protein
MISEIIAIAGSVFIAASLTAKLHQRRQDVLHGPYIEGRDVGHPLRSVMERLAQAILSSELRQHVARLGWRVRDVSYFASVIC